jgi:hypothetical protein
MAHQNVELIRKVNEVWSADPLNPPVELFDPEVEWETRWPGLPRWFRGHEGLVEWVERAIEPMDIQMDLIAARSLDDATVLARYRVHGQGDGKVVRPQSSPAIRPTARSIPAPSCSTGST